MESQKPEQTRRQGPTWAKAFTHRGERCYNCGSLNIRVVRTEHPVPTVIVRTLKCQRPECCATWKTTEQIPPVDIKEATDKLLADSVTE